MTPRETLQLGPGTIDVPKGWAAQSDAAVMKTPPSLGTMRAHRVRSAPFAHVAFVAEDAASSMDDLSQALLRSMSDRKECKRTLSTERRFADGTFGVEIVATVEPIPGFAATQRHVLRETDGGVHHLVATCAPGSPLERELDAVVASYRV